MEDEWEEEEQLVVVELSGIINNEFLTKSQGTCKILDIDSDNPVMQVGQYVFAGEYEDALGTCVIFEEGPQKGRAASGPELKYMCHTVKKLMMQRIFLTEKKEELAGYDHFLTKPSGSGESDKQDILSQSNQQEQTDDDMANTVLEDSAN